MLLYNVSMRPTAECSIISSLSPFPPFPFFFSLSLWHFFQRIVHRYRRANYSVAMTAVGRFVAFNWRRTKWSIMPCIIIGNFYVACAATARRAHRGVNPNEEHAFSTMRSAFSFCIVLLFFFSADPGRRSYALRKNACDHISSHRPTVNMNIEFCEGSSCALSREQRIPPVSSFFY